MKNTLLLIGCVAFTLIVGSSGGLFTVKDTSGTLYMSDVPKTDETGIIFFFKLVDGSPVVVNNNAGTVNYMRGEIKLTTIIFT